MEEVCKQYLMDNLKYQVYLIYIVRNIFHISNFKLLFKTSKKSLKVRANSFWLLNTVYKSYKDQFYL